MRRATNGTEVEAPHDLADIFIDNAIKPFFKWVIVLFVGGVIIIISLMALLSLCLCTLIGLTWCWEKFGGSRWVCGWSRNHGGEDSLDQDERQHEEGVEMR